MERLPARWQQDLGSPRLRVLCLLTALVLVFPCLSSRSQAAEEGTRGGTFAVALPELEGPITLGIFSSDGTLVRLLHRDTPVQSLPAGLNGLLLTWDGNDDRGVPVPPATYRARGLIHGPVTAVAELPTTNAANGAGFTNTWLKPSGGSTEAAPINLLPPEEHSPTREDPVLVCAAPDPLYEERPMVPLTTKASADRVTLLANGLPLTDLPTGTGTKTALLSLTPRPGTVRLTLEGLDGKVIWSLSGLEKIVPLEAGTLTVEAPNGIKGTHGSGAFLSPPERPDSAP